MSKAIIEIEKPKRCKDCVWYQADPWFGGSCTQAKEENGWNKHIDADDEYNVQNWCPLSPKTDAIPIEWIAKQRIDTDEQGAFTTAYLMLIEKWREENEID